VAPVIVTLYAVFMMVTFDICLKYSRTAQTNCMLNKPNFCTTPVSNNVSSIRTINRWLLAIAYSKGCRTSSKKFCNLRDVTEKKYEDELVRHLLLLA